MDRAWFLNQQRPELFYEEADRLRIELGGERFFNKPGISWLREAWTIGKFGIATGADQVWLSNSDPPDGYAKISDREYPIEVTEAINPNRRRGKEYRDLNPQIKLIDDEEITSTQNNFTEWTYCAIRKKIEKSKSFDKKTIILVHLNAMIFFLEDEEIYNKLRKIIPEPSENIIGYSIYNNNTIYLYSDFFQKKYIKIESKDQELN